MSSIVCIPLLVAYDIGLSWQLLFVLAILLAAFNAIGLGLLLAPPIVSIETLNILFDLS